MKFRIVLPSSQIHASRAQGEFMNQLKIVSLVAIAAVLSPLSAMAQRPRISPHETTSAVVDGNRVTLVYGRPFSKDPKGGEIRKIWGALVPFGKAWRLGSDEATLLITQKPMSLAIRWFPPALTRYTWFPMKTAAN